MCYATICYVVVILDREKVLRDLRKKDKMWS